MARPKKEITEKILANLCKLGATRNDCAVIFECDPETITSHCKDFGYQGFSEFKDQWQAEAKFKLIKKAYLKSLKGNGDNYMLSLCLKNMAGWSEKNQTEHKGLDHSQIMAIIHGNPIEEIDKPTTSQEKRPEDEPAQ